MDKLTVNIRKQAILLVVAFRRFLSVEEVVHYTKIAIEIVLKTNGNPDVMEVVFGKERSKDLLFDREWRDLERFVWATKKPGDLSDGMWTALQETFLDRHHDATFDIEGIQVAHAAWTGMNRRK